MQFISFKHKRALSTVTLATRQPWRMIKLAALVVVSLCSCSNISTVSTNLDGKNFSDYFAPSHVEIFASESDIKDKYQFVAGVEGESCQVKAHHAVPDEIDARTQARRAAYQLGANAIVFSGCALLSKEQLQKNSSNASHCHAQLICYGKAYNVNHQPPAEASAKNE